MASPRDQVALLTERLRERPVALRDALLAVPVAAIVVMAAQGDTPLRPDSPWTSVGLAALAVAALTWRRVHALATWVVVLGLAVAVPPLVLRAEPLHVVLAFATYSALVHDDRLGIAPAVVLSASAGLTGGLLVDWQLDGPDAVTFLMASLPVAYGVGLGAAMRANRRAAVDLAERNRELEALHGVAAREAVLAERGRISRELHDIVAHHVSGMVLQAKAARASLAARPEQLAAIDRALGEIASSGSEAMASLRGLLGILREDGGPGTSPQPTLADLPELVDASSSRGVATTLVHHGEPRPLTADVELSAYRIVQEALTNTARHAGARHAEVHLRWEQQVLEVVVDDDGVGPVAGAAPGYGIVGMQERAALVGGSLTTGPSPLGGWRVLATLPHAPAPAATP